MKHPPKRDVQHRDWGRLKKRQLQDQHYGVIVAHVTRVASSPRKRDIDIEWLYDVGAL